MVSIVIGIVCIIFFVFVAFPILPWEAVYLTEEIVFVLKGGIPLLVVIFGLFCMLVGITDVVDKRNARKETEREEEFERSGAKK